MIGIDILGHIEHRIFQLLMHLEGSGRARSFQWDCMVLQRDNHGFWIQGLRFLGFRA